MIACFLLGAVAFGTNSFVTIRLFYFTEYPIIPFDARDIHGE